MHIIISSFYIKCKYLFKTVIVIFWEGKDMLKKFDLKQKKVIDVDTAEVVGYIRDIDIDIQTGKIKSVSIPCRGIFGIFRDKSVSVPWERVIAVGKEFVIIKSETR